jgi:hypothetical protein
VSGGIEGILWEELVSMGEIFVGWATVDSKIGLLLVVSPQAKDNTQRKNMTTITVPQGSLVLTTGAI